MSVENSAILCVGFPYHDIWQLPDEWESDYMENAVIEMNEEIKDCTRYDKLKQYPLEMFWSSVHQIYLIVSLIANSGSYSSVQLTDEILTDTKTVRHEMGLYFDKIPNVYLMNLQD